MTHAGLRQRLVSDAMWAVVEPLLPDFNRRPQGGGTAPRDERTVFAAVAYVLTSGCGWKQLPAAFHVSPATAHRRFAQWTEAGLWQRLRYTVPGVWEDRLWLTTIVDAAQSRSGAAVERSEAAGVSC